MDRKLEVNIYGRVQGVNLRRRLSHIANQLRLKGYVKNLDDGSVYMIAIGSEKALEDILSWIQKASFPAKITGLKINWSDECSGDYKIFKIEKEEPFLIDEANSFVNLSKQLIENAKINVPKHVVIIPDGNRRWARSLGFKAYVGHRRAVEAERLVKIFQECMNLGVEYLTLWAFSTENWDREQEEIEELFKIMKEGVSKIEPELIKNKIRFRRLGRTDRISKDLISKLSGLEDSTKQFSKLNFQLCVDYGGRNSLVSAVNKILTSGLKQITEQDIMDNLDSWDLPSPDLIIRTSGEQRLSGIMPFESVYSELYFTNVYFPDFDSEHFVRAILDYSGRTRRFGGTQKDDSVKSNLIDPDLR
jgi:undecaprenyl diphosphate synthase